MGIDLLRAVEHDLLEHQAALRQQLRAECGFERRQAALEQRLVVVRDPRGERLARRQREHAVGRDAQRLCGLDALPVDLRVDLAGGGERIDQRVDLVQHDEARQRLAAEVIAPDAEIGLGHAGVGAEDEDGRVRGRQQAQRQLGLGSDRVQARRVEHDQALLQQRVRVVDQRMAPGRHLDAAGGVDRRVVIGLLVVPEAEVARGVLADPFGARDLLQRLRELVGVVDLERADRPGAALQTQLGERLALEPGRDRQQHQRGRFFAVPGQLDRAHRGAARRGRQHTAAGVGEEDRVDQLGLAARELGDEGDHQFFVAQAFAQRGHLHHRGGIDELVVDEEARHLVEPPRERRSPAAQGVETEGERRRHGCCRHGCKQRKAMVAQGRRGAAFETSSHHAAAPNAKDHRFWQPAQK